MRLLGVLGLAVCAASFLSVNDADVLIDGNGRLMAVRGEDGKLIFSSKTTARALQKMWLQREGDADFGGEWPLTGTADDGRLRCDPEGCVYRHHGRTVALVRSPDSLPDDCRLADVVVSVNPVPRPCGHAIVIDAAALARGGTHVLTLMPESVDVETVNDRRGIRPWVLAERAATHASSHTFHGGATRKIKHTPQAKDQALLSKTDEVTAAPDPTQEVQDLSSDASDPQADPEP